MLRCWLLLLKPRRTASPRNFRGFRRKLSRKLLMSLVFPVQFLEEIANFWNFLESRRKFFGTFWRFFEHFWSLLKQCRGAGARGRSPSARRQKNISIACYNGRDRSPVMASDDPSRSAAIAIARSHGARRGALGNVVITGPLAATQRRPRFHPNETRFKVVSNDNSNRGPVPGSAVEIS
jgi:hypothetical protein